MEEQYQLKCELKHCFICKQYIEYSNTLMIIEHKHFHRDCIISFFFDSL